MTDFTPLREATTAPVLTPGDSGYATELLSNNRFWQHTPEAVVAVTSVDDIAAVVRFAAEHTLPIRVLATGHGDESAITDGIVISTKHLLGVTVNPEAKTATFSAGTTWADIVAAADAHHLAAITGAAPGIGAVGYLLGGGIGPLVRSHGISSDYLTSLTLVTADADIVTADAATNPDLFWALRGGKGGFGVVTEATIRLVELPALYAGNIMFAEEHIEAVLRGWVDYTATAPASVSTSVAIMRFPPLPELPPFLSGKTLIALRFAFPGGADEGAALVAPLRALAPSVVDSVRPMGPMDVPSIHEDPTDPAPSTGVGGLLSSVDHDFATALLGLVGAGEDIALVSVELRHLGAAAAVDVPEGSAAGGRIGAFTYYAVGILAEPEHVPTVKAACAELVTTLGPWLSPQTMVNMTTTAYLDPVEFAEAWPPAIFDRLATLRVEYDPTRVFPYAPV
ncbi:FAD-binding oxidoreductase [Subtercola lobariae]|uniref:FAD-linked oxidase n=1 Tax=Subtercola lobariae TaxID=1588641 RepID=A0A917ETA8_9MICO|nr:FAD-binding oxidoreductase [Subtercola lobariae]GGF12693.1 FAD-linked oxidase [Subtercola lobariae]